MDLLLIIHENKSHDVLIKDFDRFLSQNKK